MSVVSGGAQQFSGAAAAYAWSIPASATSSLSAGSRLGVEVTMAVQVSSGSAKGAINSVAYTA